MQDNRYTPQPRKYSKSNFVDLVELLTPEVYQREDLDLSGTELNPLSEIINSNVAAAANISEILSISGVANSQTSTLGNISGISQYFVKQNNLTNITPFTLESKLLLPLGSTFSNFDSSADFNNYLSGTLLPLIIPATGSEFGGPKHNITTLSALTNNPEPSSVHNYLVDALGWFYFLNTSADGGLEYDPSSYVLSSFNTLYTGERLTTVDGIKGFTEYLWRNYQTCSTFRTTGTIPATFVSAVSDTITETSAGVLPIYTSGIQKLDKLKTLIEVIYSPLFIDQQDFTVKDAFQNYIDASIVLNDQTSKGPTRKFNNLLGFEFADISNQMDEIGLIYDIENTKDEHLQYLAQMIGWKLRGISADGWRHQLRKATDLYKKSGTLESIQSAVNLLIVDSVLNVSGQTTELWESYLPYMIWYALGTESDLFKDLTTWTFGLAQEAGVASYSPSSLDDNLKSVTDYIILELYKRFPDSFQANGSPFPVPQLHSIDLNGALQDRYAIVGEPNMPPFHGHIITEPGYESARRNAEDAGYGVAWRSSISMGPLGSGVYMKGLEHPNYTLDEVPEFLSATGDLQFLFSYRDKVNYAMPPFEEHKYYADCNLTPPLMSFLKDKLKCFQVDETFADNFESFVLSAGINTDTNLGSLNEFMMYFSSVQVAPNFDKMLLNISDYQRNLLDLWNGKSSHLFIDFNSDSFDFAKDTLEGDGKYALYEASRITKEFSPAHAIPLINLNASAEDDTTTTGTRFSYLGLDNDMTRASYTSASILGNFSYSGVNMGAVAPGDTDGRGGLNTFTRNDVDKITDTLLSSTTGVADLNSVGRRALRRRNLRYLLPREGYYDRTGFNGPVSYDPSTLEYSMPSSLGELTLGYVASAGKFYPIVDPMTPSGVWDACEKLGSSRSFSGVATSATFPYRGLNALGSDARAITTSATARYVDRGQLPPIYNTMHQLFEDKALNYAAQETNFGSNDYLANNYWKDELQSFANSAIASGLVLNSFDDYINFSFGTGLQKTYADYCLYFLRHDLGLNEAAKTGGNIIAQVFGRGLFNCDFDLEGSAVGNMISPTVDSASAINAQNVWNPTADGTFIASSTGESVVPLSGSFVSGNPNNADFRNPAILSGIEFTDISGAPSTNRFSIFKLDPSNAVAGGENPLIDNTVIKCKALGGLPRLRFDLSKYGDRRNYFIKDHEFKLQVKALVGEESSYIMGGGRMGAWIHTQPTQGIIWSWTPEGKWEHMEETDVSIPKVLSLAHKYDFATFDAALDTSPGSTTCLNNVLSQGEDVINDHTLLNIRDSYFETFEIDFDTRNFTQQNNSEYLQIIPIPEDIYKITQQVNTDSRNYVVELFFIPNSNPDKYLLIEDIQLQDVTQREQASLGTGYGIETSGIPNKRFVKEDRLYLEENQLLDVLKFYNGLIGKGIGIYATNLASRDSTITSEVMDLSGGSRLNYRLSPSWGATNLSNTAANFNNFKRVELDN
tara:strand:- start:986 stop:5410 length:4425 start_codon:yes stop_codon:yes gene_type:complete